MNFRTILIYIIADSIALLLLYLSQRAKERKKYKTSFVCTAGSFLILLSLIAFRSLTTGRDTANYAGAMDRVINDKMVDSDKDWLSIGYIAICKIIGLFFGSDYVILNLVIGAATLFFLYKAILENSKSPVFSLFIFIAVCLYYQTFNQSRQLLAISMSLYSLRYIYDRDIVRFILMIMFAASIHVSAFVMLPFYAIANIRINPKYLKICVLLAAGVLLFSNQIIGIISGTTYGQIYYVSDGWDLKLSAIINLSVRVIMLFCSMFLVLKNKKLSDKKVVKDEKTNALLNMAIWCTILQLLALRLQIFSRVTTYLFVFYIILIPNILEQVDNPKLRKWLFIGAILLFIAYHFVYFYFVSENSGYNNYLFFFEA